VYLGWLSALALWMTQLAWSYIIPSPSFVHSLFTLTSILTPQPATSGPKLLKMSSSPSYISREQLSKIIKETPNSVAIIDVRDEDHVGGHIFGSQHVPSSSLDYKMPELARTLKNVDKVVFHCQLSQQRGPSAARRYLGEAQRLKRNEAGANTKSKEEEESGKEPEKVQEVLILDGGFTKWQQLYGPDKTLTENYAADIWQFD
jgi:rhodanese-related sulfurtransferase